MHPRISLINFTTLAEKSSEIKLEARKELPSADLRIRDLTLRNFRKFPDLDINIRWGLDVKKENNIEACSLFLTGNNGTGKTSLFNALEYLYTGHICTMEERGVTGGMNKYITHGYGMQENNRLGNSQVAVNCMDDNRYTVRDYLQFPSVNFCSDYDVYKFSQNGEVMNSYILEYMGYKEIEELTNYIVALREEYTNVYNRKIPNIKLNRQELATCIEAMLKLYASQDETFSATLKDIIQTLTDLHERLSKITFNENDEDPNIASQLTNLHKDVEHVIETNNRTSEILKLIFKQYQSTVAFMKVYPEENMLEPLFIRNYFAQLAANVPKAVETLGGGIGILQLLKRWIPSNRNISADDITQFIRTYSAGLQEDVSTMDVKNIQEKCDAIIPCLLRLEERLTAKKNELIKLFYDTSSKFICEILNYFSNQNEHFEMECINNTITFRIKVMDESGSFTAGAREYFNTFRYKLFVVSLKTALAFSFMKEHKCLLPVVIDDIFNSSDFNNGYTIEYFVRNVYWTFDQLLREVSGKKQLQIILFTHDELVIHSFKKGYMLYHYMMLEEHKEQRPYNIICGRLFDYKDILENKQFIRKAYNNFDPYINLYTEVLKW